MDQLYGIGAYGSGTSSNSGGRSSGGPRPAAPVVNVVQAAPEPSLLDTLPMHSNPTRMPGDTMSAPPPGAGMGGRPATYADSLNEMLRRAGVSV